MNSESIESLVRDVLYKMSNTSDAPVSSSTAQSNSSVTVKDYPLANKHPDWVKTSTGKTLDDITLANVLNGSVKSADMRITPEILRIQADIARSAGRERLAINFERAAELTAVPDDRVLEIYNALRPYRSTKEELIAISDELKSKYHATICSQYVREAADLYVERKKLKGDD
ncbi:propanediol dehydratase small subunit PduE [Vibrio plantisponsor]|jgi:propanediol dehydratase small subunit|uniref:Propanediol dehydratase small subunit PduE n=2 Tax=Vibrio TaxID=662 RepID=A0A6G7CIK1_9VIBR|nr:MULTISPECIES: propanediol dehydratase small subunit PduE [Vibrio]PNH87268.1 propanediol dehydratase small subunit PduE [Vibrio diazotrophicus]QIH41876.1 propanediol dehydratase small subunit PduE [Vibrio ziniensis]RAS60553.1 propanediol dehydratase small subunit [Vibrio diazotrophicus]